MVKDAQTEFVTLLISTIHDQEIAEAAANKEATAYIYKAEVRDKVMREITLGHCVVVVAYGSQVSCDKVIQALNEASVEGAE
jgi:hypothetical protein